MKIQLLDLAEADLLAGHDFYERQAPGVGMYFLDTLHSDIDSLRLYAGTHRRVYEYHRLLSRRFPYAVYYKINGELIEIWRVLDCRRDPRWIAKQVRRKPGT